MRKVLLMTCVTFGLLTSLQLPAQELQAIVSDFSGKVELKQPGQAWQPVEANMVVPVGATISTGFASRLVLSLGQTRITVRPLTRMLLRDLVRSNGTNTTRLELRVGKVNAVVKAAQGEKNDFTLKGPLSTASVRGTEFNYDANVDDFIEVVDSVVTLTSAIHQTVTLFPKESVATTGTAITSPETTKRQSSTAGPRSNDLLTSSAADQGGSFLPAATGSGTTANSLPSSSVPYGTISVTVN